MFIVDLQAGACRTGAGLIGELDPGGAGIASIISASGDVEYAPT